MKHYIIIGNSAAGISAAQKIREKDVESKLSIISDEEYPAYYRCLISYFLSGGINLDKLSFKSLEFYKENNIDLFLNKKVIKVDPKKNRIILGDNTKLDYDTLLIATGASPEIPQIKGTNKRGVFGFRTINDAKEILKLVPINEGACVLGGGLIGIKAAYGLKKKGIEVKIIVKSSQILSQVVDKPAADLVQKRLQDNGIEILTGREAAEIIGNGEVRAVKLDTGKVLASNIVVVGKGVKPNIELVKEASVNTDYGILVNENLATNIPNIFAAGDVAQAYDLVQGAPYINALWPNAVEQGRTAAENMTGDDTKYDGSIAMNSVDFFGLSIISMGIKRPRQEGYEEIYSLDKERSIYRKIVLRDNHVVGMVAVGDIKNSGLFLRLIREKIDVSDIKQELLEPTFNYVMIMDRFTEKDEMYFK